MRVFCKMFYWWRTSWSKDILNHAFQKDISCVASCYSYLVLPKYTFSRPFCLFWYWGSRIYLRPPAQAGQLNVLQSSSNLRFCFCLLLTEGKPRERLGGYCNRSRKSDKLLGWRFMQTIFEKLVIHVNSWWLSADRLIDWSWLISMDDLGRTITIYNEGE